ncbi:MAG: FecR domain-containing protein [Pseudomonadota bacterium]
MRTLVLLCLMLGGWFSAANAAEAGKVVSVAGRAAAATLDGDIRNLGSGGQVNTGDTVVTSRNSYVRLKLVDGASVILRPNSRFQIEDYKVADNDADNRSVFNLIKGGFRAVTGLIGKRNRRGVQVRTAVATIGIRGTNWEVVSCAGGSCGANPDGDYYTVYEGGITVSNNTGTLDINPGDYGYIAGPDAAPQGIPENQADPLIDGQLPDPACN